MSSPRTVCHTIWVCVVLDHPQNGGFPLGFLSTPKRANLKKKTRPFVATPWTFGLGVQSNPEGETDQTAGLSNLFQKEPGAGSLRMKTNPFRTLIRNNGDSPANRRWFQFPMAPQ